MQLIEGCEVLSTNGLDFPAFTGRRIMMMPFRLNDVRLTVPLELQPIVFQMISDGMRGGRCPEEGVAYLTYDEKTFYERCTHRRSGLHVDGVYRSKSSVLSGDDEPLRYSGGSWGGGGGGWGGAGVGAANGFLLASDVVGCRVYGIAEPHEVDDEGEFIPPLSANPMSERMMRFPSPRILPANTAVWLDPMMVHESMIQAPGTKRALIRISLPSNCPWFEGYTESPFGVKPTGPILPRRPFMDM